MKVIIWYLLQINLCQKCGKNINICASGCFILAFLLTLSIYFQQKDKLFLDFPGI